MVNLEGRSNCLREEVVKNVYHSGRRDIVVGLFCWFGLVGGVFLLGWGFFLRKMAVVVQNDLLCNILAVAYRKCCSTVLCGN